MAAFDNEYFTCRPCSKTIRVYRWNEQGDYSPSTIRLGLVNHISRNHSELVGPLICETFTGEDSKIDQLFDKVKKEVNRG